MFEGGYSTTWYKYVHTFEWGQKVHYIYMVGLHKYVHTYV
jgi:hypothetical protein